MITERGASVELEALRHAFRAAERADGGRKCQCREGRGGLLIFMFVSPVGGNRGCREEDSRDGDGAPTLPGSDTNQSLLEQKYRSADRSKRFYSDLGTSNLR
jgi:hypothetical protein